MKIDVESRARRRLPGWAGVRKAIHFVAVVLVFLCAAEITARVDDRFRQEVPLAAVPDHDRDLVIQDLHGIRGKPNGRYKKWRLNEFGFRNGEMSALPHPDVLRIMTLGASETFGLFEADGKEYPAQIAAILNSAGTRSEVINAAVPGLTLRGIVQLWKGWAAQFRPRIVVVYPTPAFYLGEYAPRYPVLQAAKPHPSIRWWMPRMLDRLRDKFDFPDFVQRWRIERLVQAEERRRDPSWFFQAVPADRLNQFHADLTELVEAIRAEGGCPILLTHATAFRQPLDASEMNALRGLRVIRPRAPETVLIEFEEAARGATLAVARETGTDVVDVSAQMTGRREWFAPDFLHFNDDGAAEIGKLIAAQVAAQLRADAK